MPNMLDKKKKQMKSVWSSQSSWLKTKLLVNNYQAVVQKYGTRELQVLERYTSTTKGSEAAAALRPSVSYISLTPRLSQMYTITPLSNLIKQHQIRPYVNCIDRTDDMTDVEASI